MIRDMHEEIRLERQNAERQASLEKREAAMRDVQLAETHRVLGGHKNAFAEYVTFAEKEENVSGKEHNFIDIDTPNINTSRRDCESY